jgi:integrase
LIGRKKVILPIHTELLFAIETEYAQLKPEPTDRVLLNPATGKPMTRPGLYRRMLALGRRAGVQNADPHRFRDTLAVDMLNRGASPYDVAKMLGDTIDTVERHYTPLWRNCGTGCGTSSRLVLVSKKLPKCLHKHTKAHKGSLISSKV